MGLGQWELELDGGNGLREWKWGREGLRVGWWGWGWGREGLGWVSVGEGQSESLREGGGWESESESD